MIEHNWSARTKTDLIIEVWEKLDCESVGEKELEAIETVVKEVYGGHAADPPMIVARLLADEGAVLRHSEILEMDAARRLNSPYDAMFRNLISFSSFAAAESSLRSLENLRRKLDADGDREGLRRVKEEAFAARDEAKRLSAGEQRTGEDPAFYTEIAEWFSIWLQSPEIFEGWVRIRKRSEQFREAFAKDEEE